MTIDQPDSLFSLLLPRPKRVEIGHTIVPRKALDSSPEIERAHGLGPGAYTLELNATRPQITAGDESGARHAAATLAQIRRLPGNEIPAARIEDRPAIGRRGVMLDISRCRVPQMREFTCLLDTFASLKLDHLQCYTEHAFAYPSHPTVWEGADPITPSEARSLSGLCRRHGIELAANQNCFGHLTRWLEHPEYAHLAETHGEWIFAGMPRSGPFSLCPTDPDALPFVAGLLDQLLPCFDSKPVNIGCDETHDVGQGRSAGAVREKGKAAVYGTFVGAVCEAVIARGKTPMFWSDIATEHPRALDRIPLAAHALVWGYEPGHDFSGEAMLHASVGRPWWACPGTSSWRGFTGRSLERQKNIRQAAAAGVEHGAVGVLITDWGDLGHRQVWPISLLSIAEGADAAWTGTPRDAAFLDAVSLQVFGDPSLGIAHWIEALGDVDEPIRAVSGPVNSGGNPAHLANATALFTELHHPPLQLNLPEDPAPWQDCRDRLTDLGQCVPTGAGPLIEAELHHAVACAMWACDIALARRGVTGASQSLRSRRDAIKLEHARLWHQRSRPGGLVESLAYWDAIELG